ADLNITQEEERKLGENVSTSLRDKFGVYQDAEVAKYVTLVGNVLAQGSSRANLNWTFIVLDTDAVNAFAAPGGIIHVTRGLLGLAKNEAELAGVLGHEITHVTAKHTVRFIQKSKGISVGSDLAGGGSTRDYIISKMSEKAFHVLLDGTFSREDENEADKDGVEGDGKEAKKDEPKKKGGLFGKVGLSSGSQAQNTQTTASAGSRGVGIPDRDATGGSNKSTLGVKITPADLVAFKKGIVG